VTTEPRPVWLVIERTMIGPRPALFHGDKPTEKRTGSAPRVFERGPFRVPVELSGRSLPELVREKQRSEWEDG
jgi:hypothetical protein